MLDDKLVKAAIGTHKIAAELGATSHIAFPLMETIRAIEQSGLGQTLKIVEERNAFVLAALKPMEELQRATRVFAESSLLPECRRSLAQWESHFSLPELSEVGRLVADFHKSSVSEALTAFAHRNSELQRAIEQMATPWLRAQETMRSMGGLAELQGIGRALGTMGGFDENLAAALRDNLGDWRDEISWRSESLNDLSQRADFYAGLGFNHALTDFPAPAFAESLDISGVRREPPTLIARYGAPVPYSGDEEQEERFERASAAYDWLQRLETQVRAFIDEQMTRAFGADWPRRRLPNNMYDQWRERKRRAQDAGGAEWPLIAYADFTDYALVICRADNWREVFAVFFGRHESVRESFQRLYPIRLDTMHARPITQDDELLLFVEARRLMKIICGD